MKAWMSSNFGKFAIELRPLINVRIEFLLNILKTNRQITALDSCQNLVFTQYLWS